MTDGPLIPDATSLPDMSGSKTMFGSIESPTLNKDVFNHHGVTIEGISGFEDKNIVNREQVATFLDQFPSEYFDMVKLGKIKFDSKKHYTIMRDDSVCLVSEDELTKKDIVLRRVRAQTNWNSEVKNGQNVASDGKQTITIYSTENWEGENQTDVALYSLAHELGHVTWNAIDPQQGPAIWNDLISRRKILPFEIRIKQLSGFINEWSLLPESTLPRFVSYKKDFLREQKRGEGFAAETTENLSHQEDFAVSHEYMFHWKDLNARDRGRYELLSVGYELISEIAK